MCLLWERQDVFLGRDKVSSWECHPPADLARPGLDLARPCSDPPRELVQALWLCVKVQ